MTNSGQTASGLINTAGRKVKKKFDRSAFIFICAMLALPILNWLVFWFYVNIQAIAMAFQNASGQWSLENFPKVWESLTNPIDQMMSIQVGLKNTLGYFALGLFVIFPISLIMSFFIYKKIMLYKSFRVIFYLPAIISGVVMSTVYMEFIKSTGPLGEIAKWFGFTLPPEGLLARYSTATKTIMVFCVWTGFSGNILLFNGAMSRIPQEIIESAKLDGVGPVREVVNFVIPLIWPSMSTMLILQLCGLLGASGPILLFDPRAEYETMTISYWIFYQVYGGGGMGDSAGRNLSMVSTAGLCFTAVMLPIVLLLRKLMEKIPAVEY